MNITDTCPCGAVFTADDEWAANTASAHTKWLEAHAACRTAPKIELRERHDIDSGIFRLTRRDECGAMAEPLRDITLEDNAATE